MGLPKDGKAQTKSVITRAEVHEYSMGAWGEGDPSSLQSFVLFDFRVRKLLAYFETQ
jgi:hypothetical protein